MDRYPYTNFHELNLTYFLKHFTEIFQQWDSLYQEMQTWKDATEEELETWKNGVIADIRAWETTLLGEVGDWEDALMASLEAWKTAFETLFDSTFSHLEDIKTDAEAARDAAIAAQEAAEAAAATLQLDPTLSNASKAAQAKAVGDLFGYFLANNTSENYVIKGGITIATGEYTTGSVRLCTDQAFSQRDCARIFVDSGYEFMLYAWNGTTYLGSLKSTGVFDTNSGAFYMTSHDMTQYPSTYRFKISVKTTPTARVMTMDDADHVFYKENRLGPDSTLTISGEAADSATVGTALTTINGSISDINTDLATKAENRLNVWSLTELYGIHTDGQGENYSFHWNEDGTICTVNSVGTDYPRTSKNVFNNTSSAAAGVAGGDKYYFVCETSAPTLIAARIYWYINGTLDQTPVATLTSSMEFTLPADCTGILYRIELLGGAPITNETIHIEILNRPDTSGGEVITNTFEITNVEQTVTLTATPSITTDTNNYLAASGDSTDRAADILSLLSSTGVCNLGPGDFYCSGIVMPDYSSIRGSGSATRLILTSDSTSPLITMNTRCSVYNMTMMGRTTSITPSSIGTRDGILWQGTYTDEEHSYTAPYRGMVSNVFFYYFAGSAIKLNNTGDQTFRCLTVSDCFISSCGCGINIARVSEYNRFDSCSIYGCWIGVINNGGNNVFTGCSISGNKAGFVIDNSDGAAYNNAHGSCIGCLFNHNGNGNSYAEIRDAVRIIRSANGFTFTGCNIFFGHINIDRSNGVIFDSCLMRGDDITVNAGGTVLFSDNIFTYQPTVTKTGATHVIAHDNYIKSTGAGVTF